MLADQGAGFTAAELKVVETLLASYPSAALTSISNLAGQAGVSDPTVYRMVVKLGFDGYPSFQRALLAEVDEAMNSPLSRLGAPGDAALGEDFQKGALASLAISVERVAQHASPEDFNTAVELLGNAQSAVFCTGGRSSLFLASRLASHLTHIRPKVRLVEPALERANEVLVDIGPDDALVVFDYRRYQKSVIDFAAAAHRQGARIILFTDEWQSPIAGFATATLSSFVQTGSPFDTKVPALAQSETLIAALIARFPEEARRRLEAIEAVRSSATPEGASIDF
ncbi:MurR/RpiR family transcriptional regulator [Cupriavidus basilensis]|uniref:MurR/RpiR family transcriptional regulator n=1 Tax=Cupriavidus basilensis TaxID=68895 RepID=UPI0020A6C539|nr:MurR/RpiR family transcriptional regulator [Cupriavidus basilensis]MCP3018429.1 MurR/RpiR family transcriptional regulator [Cupriavidus basilensis]